MSALLNISILVSSLAYSVLTRDLFTAEKWIGLGALSCITGVFLLLDKEVLLPKVDKSSCLALCTLIVSLVIIVCKYYFYESPLIFNFLLKALIFSIFLIAFYQYFKKDDSALNKIGVVFIAVSLIGSLVGISQFFDIHIIPFLPKLSNGSSFWGNTNMAASCIFPGTIFHITFLLKRNIRKRMRIALFLGLLLCTYYLIILYCRSILISYLAIVVIVFLKNIKDKKYILYVSISAVSIIAFLSLLPLSYKTFNKDGTQVSRYLGLMLGKETNKNTVGSLGQRLSFWQASLLAIRDKPLLGMRPGGVEFELIPYRNQTFSKVNEFEILNTPHNDLLHLSVEHGLQFLLSLLFLITVVLSREVSRKRKLLKDNIFVFFSLYLIGELLFQFPLSNAYSFLVIIFISSYILSIKYKSRAVKRRVVQTFILVPMLLVLITIVFSYSYSKLNEVVYSSYREVSFACRLMPSNWDACLNKAHVEKNLDQFADAEQTLQDIIKWSPLNYPAHLQLALLYQKQGLRKKMCKSYFEAERILFPSSPRLGKAIKPHCD